MNEFAWNKQVDEFLAKTSQPKTNFVPAPRPPPLFSVRPRYAPPPQQSGPPRPRPRQPNSFSNNNKRPPAPVAKPSKPVERPVTPSPPPPPKPTPPVPVPAPATISKDDDENKLLETEEPTDVVDTFALIDEALFETDLLELM